MRGVVGIVLAVALLLGFALAQSPPAFPKLPIVYDDSAASASSISVEAAAPDAPQGCTPGPDPPRLRFKKMVRLLKKVASGYQDVFAGEDIATKDVFIHMPSQGYKPLSFIETKPNGNAYFKYSAQYYADKPGATAKDPVTYFKTSNTEGKAFVKSGTSTYYNLNLVSTMDEPINLNQDERAGSVRISMFYNHNNPNLKKKATSDEKKFCVFSGALGIDKKYIFVDDGYVALTDVEVSGANEVPSLYYFVDGAFSFAETSTTAELFIKIKGRYIPLSRVKYSVLNK